MTMIQTLADITTAELLADRTEFMAAINMAAALFDDEDEREFGITKEQFVERNQGAVRIIDRELERRQGG